MSVLDWVISIVVFIVALGILITIHELGHFSMAKLFNVYCQEFSIGFGPAIIKKRRKGKETYFCLRVIPLGGYVSMYGEGVELEDGVTIPEERSLEGIKKWKKAIILSAGIILNALLALTLIGISDICFPLIQATTQAAVAENSEASALGIQESDSMQIYGLSGHKLIYYEYKVNSTTHAGYFYIIDPDVTITNTDSEGHITESKWVLTYYPTGNKNASVFTDSVALYRADTSGEIAAKNETFAYWNENGYELPNYPDYTKDVFAAANGTNYDTEVFFAPSDGESDVYSVTIHMNAELQANSSDTYVWHNIGLSFKTTSTWLPFWTRVGNTFVDFGNASIAVFKGIGMLFTGGITNVSGIVGILNQSASILSQYTFATYLYFWGLISVNLAIFNLLPFPGLDGWGLLVTAIEGATRKKIPNKVKNIVSTIGLVILFAFMLIIIVLDILRWVGVM